MLDVNGLEMRPRTIDDAIEMNIKLQRQMSQLQEKVFFLLLLKYLSVINRHTTADRLILFVQAIYSMTFGRVFLKLSLLSLALFRWKISRIHSRIYKNSYLNKDCF